MFTERRIVEADLYGYKQVHIFDGDYLLPSS